MEAQMESGRERPQDVGEQVRETAARERHQSEMLARQLSTEAMKHWQRSVEGLLSLPTATALGVASSTLYMAALVARSFEVLQRSTEAIRSGMEQSRRELRELREHGGGDHERGRMETTVRTRADAGRGEVRA
jgi:hypothetical protein